MIAICKRSLTDPENLHRGNDKSPLATAYITTLHHRQFDTSTNTNADFLGVRNYRPAFA